MTWGEELAVRLILCRDELTRAAKAPKGRTKAEAADRRDWYEGAHRNFDNAYNAVVDVINRSAA